MKQKGVTLIELLIGIVIAAIVFVVASSFVASLFGVSTKQKQLEALEQVKNDIQSDITTNIKWATDSISFADGVLETDGVVYELADGVLLKDGVSLTSDDVIVNSFQVVKHSSSVNPVEVGVGYGLTGNYYNSSDLNDFALTRVDPVVDFDWGSDSPDPLVDPESFSVRWVGQIESLDRSGTYQFTVQSNDGVRLFVDDKVVIDSWRSGVGNNQGSVELEALRRYSFILEYFEESGNALISLSWRPQGQGVSLIPSSQLYPTPLSSSLEVIIELSHATDPDIQSVLRLVLSPRTGGVVGYVEAPVVTPIPTTTPLPTDTVTPSISITPTPTLPGGRPPRPTTTPPPIPSPRPTNPPTPTPIPLP